jgi:phosphatidylglycerophosphate synthase
MGSSKSTNYFVDFPRRNLANCISILGVVPLGLLFLGNGFIYIISLIIFNNIMDDLDGIAAKMGIGSVFGANLDKVTTPGMAR